MYYLKCLVCLSIIGLLKSAGAQFIPRTPCPDIFQYQSEGSEVVGVISLASNLQSSSMRVRLRLLLTQRLPSNYYGSLQLLEEEQKTLQKMKARLPILYRVQFPLRNPIPRVVEITVNGRTICSGPDMLESEKLGEYTKLHLEHTFTTFTISNQQVLSFDKLLPNNNLNNFNNDREINRDRQQQNNFNNNLEVNRNPSFQNNFNNNREITRDPLIQNNFNNNREPSIDRRFSSNFIPQPQITTSSIAPIVNSNPIEVVTSPKRTATSQTCGLSSEDVGFIPLNVGGVPIKPGSWPWLVAIYIKQLLGFSFQCGGNLISQNIVVSAAHCFLVQGTPFSASNVLVVLGRHNLFNWTEPNSKTLEPSKIILHPDYKTGGSADADIALLYLNQLVEFSQIIQPVCLWSDSNNIKNIENREGTVVGWGVDDTGLISPEPKRVRTQIVSDSVCLRSHVNFVSITSNRTFCAGKRNGIGPCSGDSGSGLMLRQNNRWTLRGLVSGALPDKNSNCDLKEYVIYVDVAKYIDWIRSYM